MARTDRTDLTDLTDYPTDRSDPSHPSDATPTCPACGKSMVLRTARQGTHRGSRFWGCTGYPRCTGTRPH